MLCDRSHDAGDDEDVFSLVIGLRVTVIGDLTVPFCASTLMETLEANMNAVFTLIGVEPMVEHFRPSGTHCDSFTWKQYRDGELFTSRCNAIMSDCRRDLLNVKI